MPNNKYTCNYFQRSIMLAYILKNKILKDPLSNFEPTILRIIKKILKDHLLHISFQCILLCIFESLQYLLLNFVMYNLENLIFEKPPKI